MSVGRTHTRWVGVCVCVCGACVCVRRVCARVPGGRRVRHVSAHTRTRTHGAQRGLGCVLDMRHRSPAPGRARAKEACVGAGQRGEHASRTRRQPAPRAEHDALGKWAKLLLLLRGDPRLGYDDVRHDESREWRARVHAHVCTCVRWPPRPLGDRSARGVAHASDLSPGSTRRKSKTRSGRRRDGPRGRCARARVCARCACTYPRAVAGVARRQRWRQRTAAAANSGAHHAQEKCGERACSLDGRFSGPFFSSFWENLKMLHAALQVCQRSPFSFQGLHIGRLRRQLVSKRKQCAVTHTKPRFRTHPVTKPF